MKKLFPSTTSSLQESVKFYPLLTNNGLGLKNRKSIQIKGASHFTCLVHLSD